LERRSNPGAQLTDLRKGEGGGRQCTEGCEDMIYIFNILRPVEEKKKKSTF